MKNNPFGKSDPRFEYQKEKIDKEREGPTGDFNVHMQAVIDKDVEKKRDAIQNTLKVQKQLIMNQPNAVFASSVERYEKAPTEQLSSMRTHDAVEAYKQSRRDNSTEADLLLYASHSNMQSKQLL